MIIRRIVVSEVLKLAYFRSSAQLESVFDLERRLIRIFQNNYGLKVIKIASFRFSASLEKIGSLTKVE